MIDSLDEIGSSTQSIVVLKWFSPQPLTMFFTPVQPDRCFLEVIPMERLVWTSMLFPGFRPAVFDDIPITAIMTMESVGTGTRYVFTALHRNEADLETNMTSGFYQGTEIAVDQLVEHVIAMK